MVVSYIENKDLRVLYFHVINITMDYSELDRRTFLCCPSVIFTILTLFIFVLLTIIIILCIELAESTCFHGIGNTTVFSDYCICNLSSV